MIIAVVASAVMAQGVSARFLPTPLPRALEILSEASGRKLAAAPALSNEVLVARLKNADVQLMLDRIAISLEAKWTPEPDGTLRLTVDQSARQLRRTREQQESAEKLRLSLEYLRKRLAAQPEELDSRGIVDYQRRLAQSQARKKAARDAGDYSRYFAVDDVEEESPAWRAAARIALVMDTKALLAMPNRARFVWSETPTRMQLPLPLESKSILSQFRREQAFLSPDAKIERITFEAIRWEFGGAYNVRLVAYGPGTERVVESWIRLNNDGELMKVPGPLRNQVHSRPDEKPLIIDAEATEIRRALSPVARTEERERQRLMAKWKSRLLNPEEHEPTSWYQGADLVALAEALDTNLIGTVSEVTGAVHWMEDQRLTPSVALSRLKYEVEQLEDGWLLARPTEPVERASRAEGGAWIKEAVRRGGVTVDEAAAWTAKFEQPYPFTNWLGSHLMTLLTGSGPYSTLSTLLSEHNLRLWHALGPVARASLKRGETVRLGALPPAAREQLAKIIYWFEGTDESADPTDVLPNGIGEGEVKLATTSETVFFPWQSGSGPGPNQSYSAESYGRALARRVGTPPDDRFLLGKMTVYSLTFLLLPEHKPVTLDLMEVFFDPGAEPLERLPAALQELVEVARREEIKRQQDARQQSPPPPR